MISFLQPHPADLRRCLALDQAEADQRLELDRTAWEAWADEPIEPFLTIRYMPAVYGVREVPAAFCTPRVSAEDNAWARARTEEWASAELKRFRAKGFLNWSRRELNWLDEGGLNPRLQPATFDDRHAGAYMRLSGSQLKFLLSCSEDQLNRSCGWINLLLMQKPIVLKRVPYCHIGADKM